MAPSAASPAPVQLVQLTDPHLFGDPAGLLRGVPTLATLQAVLAAAAPDVATADALLATGDLVQDDPGGYANFRALLARAGRPVLCVPGNHDDAAALRRELAFPPFVTSGHVDFGDWRIVLVDSSVPRQTAGAVSDAALEALSGSLAAPGPPHVLVCVHHHPLSLGSAWMEDIGITNADRFFAVLDRSPRVRGVVFGHVHQAFDGLRNGLRLLGTPSTCLQFRPCSADFALDTRPPAWRRLRLAADGSIDTDVQWLDLAAYAAACGGTLPAFTATSQNSLRT